MNNYKVGDRFYFYKNNTDSETIKVGHKGIIDVVNKNFIEEGAYAFDYDEIKPILKVKNGVVLDS